MAAAEQILLQRQQWQKHYRTIRILVDEEQNRRRIRNYTQMWHFYWFVSGYNANFAVGKMYSRSRWRSRSSLFTHTRQNGIASTHTQILRCDSRLHACRPLSAGEPFGRCSMLSAQCSMLYVNEQVHLSRCCCCGGSCFHKLFIVRAAFYSRRYTSIWTCA